MLGSMDLLLRWCNRWRLQFWKGREAAPPVRAVGVVRPDSRRRWGQPAVHVHALATGAGGTGRRLMTEADVASCAVSGGAAVEEETMALYVPPPMLRGPAKEMRESAEPES